MHTSSRLPETIFFGKRHFTPQLLIPTLLLLVADIVPKAHLTVLSCNYSHL
jgi:hypothetical protein